jgi:two-component system LytT family response regulator
MIKAIVVDDEAPSREVMTNYLRDYCRDVEVAATASSVKTAYRAIRRHNPDVVFLDIELPDGKGFDLLQMFTNIDFRVIFVTAYSEYAIRAFRVNAADYLLKPVKIDELNSAVERIRAENRWSYDQDKFAGLLKTLTENSVVMPSIVVPNIKGFEVLKINEIILCKADGYCTNFLLEGNRKVTSSKNLKYYEDLLREHNIIRVHHSYLVNISHVQSYTRQGEIMLTENNKAYLGDNFRNNYLGTFTSKKKVK